MASKKKNKKNLTALGEKIDISEEAGPSET